LTRSRPWCLCVETFRKQNNMPLTIVIDLDQVTIEGVVIKRPLVIGRSVWMSFWERVQKIKA